MKKVLVLLAACYFSQATANEPAAVPAASQDTVPVNPDLVELVMELDPQGYGQRYRDSKQQLGITVEPLVDSQLGLTYQYKVLPWLALRVPFGVGTSRYSLARIIPSLGERQNYTSIFAGIGAKFYLTEWVMKSSYFILAQLGAAYLFNAPTPLGTPNAWRFQPSLAFGWEQIFDSGLVIGWQIGAEVHLDYPRQPVADSTLIPTVGFNLGYAF